MNATQHATDVVSEFTLPGGCPLCNGDLAIRLSAHGARGVCVACRHVSRPRVAIDRNRILLEERFTAFA
ncbi:MAG: hypothetical protein ACK4N5_04740 [Myxococcales bacterium]